METYNVYLINFVPWPVEVTRQEGFSTEQEAKNFIQQKQIIPSSQLWVIIKIPDQGTKHQLVDTIRVNQKNAE